MHVIYLDHFDSPFLEYSPLKMDFKNEVSRRFEQLATVTSF